MVYTQTDTEQKSVKLTASTPSIQLLLLSSIDHPGGGSKESARIRSGPILSLPFLLFILLFFFSSFLLFSSSSSSSSTLLLLPTLFLSSPTTKEGSDCFSPFNPNVTSPNLSFSFLLSNLTLCLIF